MRWRRPIEPAPRRSPIEAIKLVEGGLASLCDEVWLIVCAADQQLARVRARGTSPGGDPTDSRARAAADSDAEARIAAQSDLVARLTPYATRVLDTSGDPAGTRALIEAAYADALLRASGSDSG